MDEKAKLRQKIDALDGQLLALLNRRMELAKAVGRIKAQKGESVDDQKREAQILDRLNRLNSGPLHRQGLESIYGEIMTAAKTLQKKN